MLAVDVDGVIAIFGFEEPPGWPVARYELIDGLMHCVLVDAGDHLRRLSHHYDLVWATGWEARANQLCELLELPELPYLTFAGSARFGSAHWKLEPLRAYAAGRRLAWIDDSFDESCYAWARERSEPTLLIPTSSEIGLGEAQVEALMGWVQGIASDPAG